MQVSSASSLTWLQSARGTAGQSSPAASTGGQDLLDASGAEGASPSSLMASLQNPSQQFSAGSLNALISAQLDQDTTGANSSATAQSGAAQSGASQADATQGDATQGQPSGALVHRHRHHGGGEAEPSVTQPATGATSTDAAALSSAAGGSSSDAKSDMAQLLTGM